MFVWPTRTPSQAPDCISGIGCAAQNKQRQEKPKAGCGGEPDAKRNRQCKIQIRHVP